MNAYYVVVEFPPSAPRKRRRFVVCAAGMVQARALVFDTLDDVPELCSTRITHLHGFLGSAESCMELTE